MKKAKVIKVGSLFAGIGGIDLGFIQAGFDIVWANEIDQHACQTYEANFNHRIIHDDIRNLNSQELEPIHILTGGFPCQPFSIAGYRKGLSDERGFIVHEVFFIAKEKNPDILFLENVKNLASHNKGETLKYIIDELKNLGYYTKHSVLNTCEYSELPQNRERLYIVGFKDKARCHAFSFPGKIAKTLRIKELLEANVPRYFYYEKTKYYDILKKAMTDRDTCYQWRRHYVRENKSNLCPTLTANMGTGGHNVPLVLVDDGIRKLTPRECLRFQGYPDNFILPINQAKSKLYKQVGNSVSVPVIKSIALQIKKALVAEAGFEPTTFGL